jgi:hypothetical protein
MFKNKTGNIDSECVLVERMSEREARVRFRDLCDKLFMEVVSNISEWRLYFLLKKRLGSLTLED